MAILYGIPVSPVVVQSHFLTAQPQRMRNKRHGKRYFIELPYESLRYYLMTDSLSKKIRHDCKMRNCESIAGREKLRFSRARLVPQKFEKFLLLNAKMLKLLLKWWILVSFLCWQLRLCRCLWSSNSNFHWDSNIIVYFYFIFVVLF